MKFIASFVATLLTCMLPIAVLAQAVVVGPPNNAIVPGQIVTTTSPDQQSSQPSSADELSQVQTLEQELTQLQTQLGGSNSSAPSTSGANNAPGPLCGAVIPILTVGSTGTGVIQLQAFLTENTSVYPQGLLTGYYGPITEKAVQAFQTQNGIVSSGSPSTTGYGQVGPKTASTVQAQCGGSGTSAAGPTATQFGGFIQVSPTSGDTPLYENVQATVNTTNDCGSSIYTLDWGDGTPSQAIQVPAGTCASEQQTYTHTYTTAGTYSITLAAGTHSSSATVVAQ